jgi:hypothetical protein
LDHNFTSHAQGECVETHILKLDWLRSGARPISESKKIKFEYSFEIIGWHIGDNTRRIFCYTN